MGAVKIDTSSSNIKVQGQNNNPLYLVDRKTHETVQNIAYFVISDMI